jgi:hypothetical protein
MVILVPPPFSTGFFAILPNFHQLWTLLDKPLTHLYTPWRDLMSSVFEIEHCPEIGIWVGFRDLVQRCVILINDLVDGTHNSSVLDRPA